jgi:hypothetical protein
VADQGDAVLGDASSSAFAGLQTWVFNGTQWTEVNNLQLGLNLGQS